MDLRITGQREARSGLATTRGALSVTPLGGGWGRIQRGELGCAICDPVIALWCLRGGPSLIEVMRHRRRARRPDTDGRLTPEEAGPRARQPPPE
ncbi:hypothetical protein GCM10010313_31050 [Streptomyces violarus]|nr:hypothetical protein GCM10010313_31050 [Streptomyces violarus]